MIDHQTGSIPENTSVALSQQQKLSLQLRYDYADKNLSWTRLEHHNTEELYGQGTLGHPAKTGSSSQFPTTLQVETLKRAETSLHLRSEFGQIAISSITRRLIIAGRPQRVQHTE